MKARNTKMPQNKVTCIHSAKYVIVFVIHKKLFDIGIVLQDIEPKLVTWSFAPGRDYIKDHKVMELVLQGHIDISKRRFNGELIVLRKLLFTLLLILPHIG
ncbi:hypothetical protein M0R45_016756 [Rubus argutus]|uniref:Uncharacterized protein n=1 Tax=Rubus argutus TaxID=59490 RepID=A0AAW1XSW7_RUBAR